MRRTASPIIATPATSVTASVVGSGTGTARSKKPTTSSASGVKSRPFRVKRRAARTTDEEAMGGDYPDPREGSFFVSLLATHRSMR